MYEKCPKTVLERTFKCAFLKFFVCTRLKNIGKLNQNLDANVQPGTDLNQRSLGQYTIR